MNNPNAANSSDPIHTHSAVMIHTCAGIDGLPVIAPTM